MISRTICYQRCCGGSHIDALIWAGSAEFLSFIVSVIESKKVNIGAIYCSSEQFI